MNPRRRTLFTAAAAAFLLFTLPPTAARDPFDDIAAQEIGSAIGRNIAGAINAAVDMRRAAAQASTEIDVARRAYWEAVRTGRGVDAAKAKFRDALDGKDLVYMMLAVPEGASGPRTIAINAISGGIDGGILPAARDEFLAWIRAIRIELGAENAMSILMRQPGQFVIPTPAQLAAALKATEKQYASYVRARDWAEIDRSGLKWPWDTDARAHAVMVLNRYGHWAGDALKERYRFLVTIYGEDTLLAAADKLRQARRNNEAKLADPEALGGISPEPDHALYDLMAVSKPQNWFKFAMTDGFDTRVAQRTLEEAVRDYNRFVIAYGEEAIAAVAKIVLQMPKKDGQIDGRSPNVSSEDLMGTVSVLQTIWRHLNKRDPAGRARAVFAFHPDVKTAAQADQLRRELERRHGREAVTDALAALLGHEPYLTIENEKRRAGFLAEIHLQAYEKRGLATRLANGKLAPTRYDHCYETDYDALVRLLKEGPKKVIGEPGPAPTQEDRWADQARSSGRTEPWQIRTYVLQQKLGVLQGEVIRDNDTYPYHPSWAHYATIGLDERIEDPNADLEAVLKKHSMAVSYPRRTAQAIRTLQAHVDLVNDPESAISRLARLSEEAIQETWNRLRALEAYRGEEFDLSFRGGAPDRGRSAFNAILGTWSGAFPRGGAITLRVAWPERPGQPLVTAHLHSTRQQRHWFFLSRGYSSLLGFLQFPDGWNAFSFMQSATAVGDARDKRFEDPPFVVLLPAGEDRLEAKWYEYKSGRYRETSAAVLQRGEGHAAPPAIARAPAPLPSPTTNPATPVDRRVAPAPAPTRPVDLRTAPLKAEAAITYDGNTIDFTGGAAEIAEIEAAANAGNVRAFLLLGELIVHGKIDGTMADAASWFEKGALRLDPECSARLARLLMDGHAEGVNPRYQRPQMWRQLASTAAARGSPLGMYLMAECSAKGIGIRPSEPIARQWYQKAAAAGHPLAQKWCEENAVSFTSAGSAPAGRVR